MTEEEKLRIARAIREAESRTSAEVRVHVEETCADPVARSRELFERFNVAETARRVGIVIYIATESRRMAVLSDVAIDDRLGQRWWRGAEEEARRAFRQNRIADGIILVIEEAGRRLAEFFPRSADDVNEMPNRVTTNEVA